MLYNEISSHGGARFEQDGIKYIVLEVLDDCVNLSTGAVVTIAPDSRIYCAVINGVANVNSFVRDKMKVVHRGGDLILVSHTATCHNYSERVFIRYVGSKVKCVNKHSFDGVNFGTTEWEFWK